MEITIIDDTTDRTLRSQTLMLTGQSISSLGKISIEILPRKRHITWVSDVLIFSAEFQMEPRAPNIIYYYTSLEVGLVGTRLYLY